MSNAEMQYIGVCALLGRLFKFVDDDESRELMQQAMEDCATTFPGRFKVVKCSGGGYSLEPILNSAPQNTGEAR